MILWTAMQSCLKPSPLAMRTAGDDFWNDTTYILPTLFVRVGLGDKRHVKRVLKASAVTQKQQCSSWHVKGTAWDDSLCFLSHCSGRRPVLGLPEELSAPFPRQRLELSVLAPEMTTKKKGKDLFAISLLCKTSVSTWHKHLWRG